MQSAGGTLLLVGAAYSTHLIVLGVVLTLLGIVGGPRDTLVQLGAEPCRG